MEKGTERTRRTRRTLLIKMKDRGNDGAWQEFYDIYRHLIYGAAIKAGLSHQEAQDVVAETMAGVLRRIALFEYDPAKGRFSGWLMRLTKWRIQDQFRKRGPQSPGLRDSAVTATRTSTVARIPDPQGNSFESLWNQEWNRNLLEVALKEVKNSVSSQYYQVFGLHVLKQLPVEKVARMLGIPRDRVYMAKFRVCKRVAEVLRRLQLQLEQRSIASHESKLRKTTVAATVRSRN